MRDPLTDGDRIDSLRERFGAGTRVFRAPGRVNLIGEHTDYNGGLVLPAALSMSCWVAAAPRADGRLTVVSEAFGDERSWDLAALDDGPEHHWSDYVRGVAVVLRRAGYALDGASLYVASGVPPGAGLSSSGALEVAVALALLDLAGEAPPRTGIAELCQRAEQEVVGVRCGVMDQMVALHAREGHAALIDCRSLETTHHRVPPGMRLVACHTMVRHAHAAGEYNRRREECEIAVRLLARALPGVGSLRDVDVETFEARATLLPDVVARRARHVVCENARVAAAAAALDGGDLEEMGRLMAASHRSLRDDFEVSCQELDALVEIAAEMPGVFGPRMTGGGFGGCTVQVVAADAVDDFRAHVSARYRTAMGYDPAIYVSEPAAGAARVC